MDLNSSFVPIAIIVFLLLVLVLIMLVVIYKKLVILMSRTTKNVNNDEADIKYISENIKTNNESTMDPLDEEEEEEDDGENDSQTE